MNAGGGGIAVNGQTLRIRSVSTKRGEGKKQLQLAKYIGSYITEKINKNT